MNPLIPSPCDLINQLEDMALKSDAVSRCFNAVKSGIFLHPDGRKDELMDVRLFPEQLGLLIYLLKLAPKGISIDVGFGMGSSATTILGTRRAIGEPFEHIVFDPDGLPDGRGLIVEDYLEDEFGVNYRRIKKRSQIGLAQIYDERGPGVAGLIFIDGFHTLDAVMTDFYFCDLLCSDSGYIVFDDARYPAIECVVDYISMNRENYSISKSEVENTVILKKIEHMEPEWGRFRPFAVPERRDWSPSDGIPMPTVLF